MSLTRRRLVLLAPLAAAALAGLVVLGRWEGDRAWDGETEGIETVTALVVRSLTPPTLSRLRLSGELSCLEYRLGENPYALALCFDDEGRLLEAVDRRGSEPRYWSLRKKPDRARIRVDPAVISRLFAGATA